MKGLEKKFVVSMLAAGFLAVGAGAGWTADGHDHEHAAAAETTEPAVAAETAGDAGTGAVEVGNKNCPVSGEEVGKMGEVVKYEHDGKIYNFCCAMCIKDFKKDPDKYIQTLNAAEEQK